MHKKYRKPKTEGMYFWYSLNLLLISSLGISVGAKLNKTIIRRMDTPIFTNVDFVNFFFLNRGMKNKNILDAWHRVAQMINV